MRVLKYCVRYMKRGRKMLSALLLVRSTRVLYLEVGFFSPRLFWWCTLVQTTINSFVRGKNRSSFFVFLLFCARFCNMKNFCNDIRRRAGDESEKKAVIWQRHVLIKKGDGQLLRLAKYFHCCVFLLRCEKVLFLYSVQCTPSSSEGF